MNNEKSIEAINALITINNDRIEGYETASKETDERDLKDMFAQFTSTSQKCRNELASEVSRLGGKPSEGTLTSGKFFRVWMDVKAALTGKDRKAILNSCDYGEETAQETYDKVIENDLEHLWVEQKRMIIAQKSLLMEDHSHVKSMRDALVDA